MNPEKLLNLSKIILALKSKVKCPICLDFVETTVQLGCAHKFCSSCLQDLRLQNLPLCPLCKEHINKRSPVYKDQFADDLSKFVNRTCQLIRETYAHEVEKLNNSKGKLQEIIDAAPQDDFCYRTSCGIKEQSEFKKPTENAFDKLKSQPKCYTNKRKQVERNQKPTLLHFTDSDNRTKIINWLNANQEKLDTYTQSPSFFTDDEADFELPSISQVPFRRKQKPSNRLRSQSLILENNLNEPLLKRYRSLTQGLNEDDYDIEEVHSELLIKQVERKVLQDILEDECLVNLEHLAQQSKDKSKKGKVTPKRRKPLTKNKSSNIPNSGSSSGWDRIKDVKKSIKKATKEPKKLNISLQETNSTNKTPKESPVKKATNKTKESPKGCTKESPTLKATTTSKKSPKAITIFDNKENENCHKMVEIEVDIPKEKTSHIFNLSAVENYFEKNIDKVRVAPDQNTSSDMEIDVIDNSSTNNLKDLNLQNRMSTGKQNNSAKDDSSDEEVFFKSTQKTPQSANQNNTLCYVAPVPNEFTDIESISVRLADNLQSCISSATNLNNELACSLVDCFTNLKTYIDKILIHRSDKKEREIQTSQIKNIAKTSVSTQTETIRLFYKTTQTDSAPVKKLTSKYIQTSQNILQSAETQTDVAVCVNQEVQATDLPTSRFTKEKSVEKIITHSVRYSFSPPPGTSKEGLNSTNITKICKKTKSSTRTFEIENPEDEEKEISTKISQTSSVDNKERRISVDNKERRISVDSSKASKSKSADISQGSFLLCSVPSNKSENKINRKLTYGETENRAFKRIRKPSSDSESDEDGKPRKRKLVRDDLTVEFIDTERGSKDESQTKAGASPESENMDCDKYLLEMMAKYGTQPEKASDNENQFKHEMKTTKLSTNKKQNSQESLNSQNNKHQNLKKESQKSSGEHIFTAQLAFEENLEKFDKEIFVFEDSTKGHSIEYDLVENTPMLSPKAKIPRLQTSNKKKEAKKHCMKEPLQILSKGSASSGNTSKRKEPLEEESLSNLTQKEPSTLNRNIENVPSQTEKCTDDVAGILEDLRHDDDFFKSNMECDENEQDYNLPRRQTQRSDEVGGNLTVAGSHDGNANKNVLNITRENIDQVVEGLDGFADDDDIEAEWEKISFTAEQRKLSDADKKRIKILQNIKLKSQDRSAVKSPFNGIIEGSDISDEEIVETTPQKKKRTSKDRSLDNLDELENNSLDIEFCLPPPPGFGDEIETSPVPDDARESPINYKDVIFGGNKSSLTPDCLTDFIVTPETMMHEERALGSQNENLQNSLTFKPSVFTPNRSFKDKGTVRHSAPGVSQILTSEPGDTFFSPIAKSTIKFSQSKYTPLVTTSRLSTRKSSLMTSTPNQKSILNYVKPSHDSSTSSQQKPKPCIMWSRILNKDLNVFTQLEVKKLVTRTASFNPQVSHLVVLVDEKGQIVSHTAKILIAIAAGIWVVRYEWAQDCLKFNRILPEEPYEALDTTGVPGPQISRLSRESKPLFKGFRFYCAPPILTIPKCDLENILQLSGGEIARKLDDFLQKDGKVNIILTESSASEETEQYENFLQSYKAVTIDVEWLTKCIGQYKLVSFRAFLVAGDDSKVCDLGYPPTLVESVPFTLTEAM